MSKYGLKIKNIQAGSLYDYNLGLREFYDYTDSMFTNSLFLDYLKNKKLIEFNDKSTRDIICLNFDYGSRSYEEQSDRLNKLLDKAESSNDTAKAEKIKALIADADSKANLFDKKSKEEIREIYYKNGVTISYKIRHGDNVKIIDIHYKMLFRSVGKAKNGSCMFINEKAFDKAKEFLYMGLELPNDNAPIVEIGAYAPLSSSTIVGKIKVNPYNVLILEDVTSFFRTKVVNIETDENKHCYAKTIGNYEVKNELFDGQGLIDSSIFPKWADGYVLLRQHMCKMACFNTNIQKFFMDYYGDEYKIAKVTDMFGNEHYVKDIKIITTNNAMKWLSIKLGITYDYWCEKVIEQGSEFGVVKTAHKSKLGDVQRMSYQMINSLSVDIMENVTKKSVEYINKLKTDDDEFIKYLDLKSDFCNDYEVLSMLAKYNPEFIRSEYFRTRRSDIITQYVKKTKTGKVIQDADNLVLVGSPYAMLLHTVGENVDKDNTMTTETDCIQCYTERFADNTYLCGFRSPHNSQNNIISLHNVWSENMRKYFNFGEQILAVNVVHTDLQDRANGCDFDSDSMYVTNQYDMANWAKYCYINFPTIVNNIPKNKNVYVNTLQSYATVDNDLSHAQLAIGESSNLAQIALTYSFNFNDQKYKDYVCILSVLAQCSIDNAKRRSDIDINAEIRRIKKDMDIDNNGYPIFWKLIKPDFNGYINKDLICPMNYLYNITIDKHRSAESTLPMSYFFNKFELDKNRITSRKIEELIEKYQLDVFKYKTSNDYDKDINLLQGDFEDLIQDLKATYISKKNIGLMSWLLDRAFMITPSVRQNVNKIDRHTDKNKTILLKVLYTINPKNILDIFSRNLDN